MSKECSVSVKTYSALNLSQGHELIVADARQYKQWWQGDKFDRILIDAPCSASGVIRRHPDIKTLRRESDIEQLVILQAEILSSAWQMLAPVVNCCMSPVLCLKMKIKIKWRVFLG